MGKEADSVRYYTWGRDLSGSLQGAGGVGGLLAISEELKVGSSGPLDRDELARGYQHRFPAYDANGNVGQLLDESGKTVAAYTYDPFGNVTEMAGAEAAENEWRFSTKPVEAGTGWLYYVYRWYDTGMGRWVNRDPIEESGGVNLYGFVGNFVYQKYDILGLVVHSGIAWPTTVPHGDGRSNCYFCEDTWVATLIDGTNSVRRCCGKTLQDASGGQFAGCCEGVPYTGQRQCCQGGALVEKISVADRDYGGDFGRCTADMVRPNRDNGIGALGGLAGGGIGYLIGGGGVGAAIGTALGGYLGLNATPNSRCNELVCPN
jgi:RHS repeat-associated protein